MTIDENQWISMKIDTPSFFGDRFSSISDINRLIKIDYIDCHRLYRLLVFIDWARRDWLQLASLVIEI